MNLKTTIFHTIATILFLATTKAGFSRSSVISSPQTKLKVTVPEVALLSGAKLLFKNSKSTLSNADKNAIYRNAGFIIAEDKNSFILDKESADEPFDAEVFIADLNGDLIEEVFIIYGNSFTSGQAGSDVLLFIKTAETGKYLKNFGFPGGVPIIIPAYVNGFPDMFISGPGFTVPIYRWNGKKYSYLNNISDKEIGMIKDISVADLAEVYLKKGPAAGKALLNSLGIVDISYKKKASKK